MTTRQFSRGVEIGRDGDLAGQDRREDGVALITAMMILILVVGLAISALDTTRQDQQVAGVQARKRVARQAAEAGLAVMLVGVAGGGSPTLADTDYGDTTAHHGEQPSYRLDTSVANAVTPLGALPISGMSLNVNGSGPKFQLERWRLNVEGQEPAGMTSRIEVATAALWGN